MHKDWGATTTCLNAGNAAQSCQFSVRFLTSVNSAPVPLLSFDWTVEMEAIGKLSTVNTDNGTGPSAVIKYNPITKSSELRNHLISVKWGDLITILLPWKVPNHRILEASTSTRSSCLHT